MPRIEANERISPLKPIADRGLEKVMKLHTELVPKWPPLAWLARLSRSQSRDIRLLHGRGVETRPDWFCEAVWDGPFEDARFDTTDIVVGSGARVYADRAVFVTAGNSLERLHVLRSGDSVFVSNSLACLLATTNARISPHYPHYHRDLRSITKGVRRHKRFLRTSRGRVEFVYFDNLLWDGASVERISKPVASRRFESFASYKQFLLETLEAVASNAADESRAYRYDLLGTLSGGYDSPALMTLAREVGCSEALFFNPPTRTADSIAPSIAERLGIKLVTVDLFEWHNRELPEIEFIGGMPDAEDIRFASAREHLSNKLVVTGARGDRLFGLEPEAAATEFRRQDTQGASLCEARLWFGFQQCAIPFWGAFDPKDICNISKSPEMAPWDIGGNYNRPICRRLLEEAGVPRDGFALSKQGQSPNLQHYDTFLTQRSWQAYGQWVDDRRSSWFRKLRLPPDVHLERDVKRLKITRFRRRLLASTPMLWRFNIEHYMPTRARRFVFPWALDVLKKRYRTALDSAELNDAL